MIERFFLIAEREVLSGNLLPPEENIYYLIRTDPREAASMQNAYALIEQSAHLPMGLALDIREPLTAESIRFITSFLFIPSYLVLEYRPVIILGGDSLPLLRKETASLSAYFSLQGIRPPFLPILLTQEPGAADGDTGEEPVFSPGRGYYHSVQTLAEDYARQLRNEHESYQPLFFYMDSPETLQLAYLSLRQAEMDFAQEAPRTYSLTRTNGKLEKDLCFLRRKLASTEAELDHQKQYVAALRSDHTTKELQDYYTREYEILPLWYKRFGHILKVLTGKRTFRSLFRDDVKKYKD